MIKHNFKIAWRSIWKAKSYSLINIVGLSAGLASFIIVLLYLNYELSYDTWSPEMEKVYRVGMNTHGDIQNNTPAPLASFFAEKYPKIEAATSMNGYGEYEVIISTDKKQIYHNGFASVDSLFLKVFPYHLIQGDRNTALNAPNSVIISQELAEELFGKSNPIGQTLKVFNVMEGVVTGVIELPETPSHLTVHLIMRDPYEKQNFFWNNYSYETYLKINQTVTTTKLEEDLNRIYFEERIKKDENLNAEYKNSGNRTLLFTDAVPDIQNFSQYGNSNMQTVSVLFILAILLLIIGAINFSNLSIAKSLGKIKEIGVRKVLGSGNWNLFWQFMAEAILQCVISLIIATGVVLLSLPYVNSIFGLELSLGGNSEVMGQIGLCLGGIILISGLFPSIFLSRFNLLKILNGGTSKGNKGLALRNVLIIFQFMVTSFFIIAIIVINKQLNYIQTK
ncbi:MAG: ABC transporter permease, partial [Salinimicrobium sp.]